MPDFAAFNCALFSVSLLVSVCLLGTSFSVITPLQMAIKYDRNIHKLYEDKVIGGTRGDSGRFFTGLKVDFLKFPKELQQLEFSDSDKGDYPKLIVRTGPDTYEGKEPVGGGVQIELALAVQYQLNSDAASLVTLYKRFGGVQKHRVALSRYMSALIMDVSSSVKLRHWWERRKEVGELMQKELTEKLRPWAVNVRALQIMQIFIPKHIQDSIVLTAAATQDILTSEYNLKVQEVQADTNVAKNVEDVKLYAIDAEATAYETRTLAKADATALNITTVEEMDQYVALKKQLGMSTRQFLTFLWLRALRENSGSHMMAAVRMPESIRDVPVA